MEQTMTVSAKSQATQASVLVGMQRRMVKNAASAKYLGELFSMSTAQVAAALKLLEDKGLVKRTERGVVGNSSTRWFLTESGAYAEVRS
jgi:DNA-binding MarR family transcriptional regulator